MRVDIVSDTICPWCYIGKRRFERALAARQGNDALDVVWWPFQLNPQMPSEGVERQAYLVERFGSTERAMEIYRQVEAAGRSEGIPFAFDKIKRTPNTLNSHRLIGFAADTGRQSELVEVLFRRYFERGENIGDIDVLVDGASEAGLDGAAARSFLVSDLGREEILAGDVAARRLGINGVPCFIVNQRYAVSGAHEPEVFARVFSVAAGGDDEAATG
jgi:predicted DsbA family dithiol-disulfide isomerase